MRRLQCPNEALCIRVHELVHQVNGSLFVIIPTWLVANCISMPSFERMKGVAITPALLLPEKESCNQGMWWSIIVRVSKRANQQAWKLLDFNTWDQLLKKNALQLMAIHDMWAQCFSNTMTNLWQDTSTVTTNQYEVYVINQLPLDEIPHAYSLLKIWEPARLSMSWE